MRIRILKWSLTINWDSNKSLDHECMNQIMDGTYECEYCYPDGV